MNAFLLFGFFSACTGNTCENGECKDTGAIAGLSASCDSAEPAADPLTLDWRVPEVDPGLDDLMIELMDVEVDLPRNRAYAVGQGGLLIYSLEPHKQVGIFPLEGGDRFHHLELLGNGLVAVTNRDLGVVLVDTTTNPNVEIHRAHIEGAHGMASLEDRLFVLDVRGALVVLDLSDPTGLSEVFITEGLGAPWDIVIEGDWAYVSDNSLGLVPIDLSEPDSPLLGEPVATAGGAQDVAVANAHAYVATGANGIEVFSLASPGVPESVGIIEFGTAIVSVSTNDSLLWGVGHEDLVVLDISTPAEPVPLAMETTPQYGMHVVGVEDQAWVADWNLLDQFSLDRTQRSPAADPSPRELLMSSLLPREIEIRNRGAAALQITGAEIDDDRLQLELDRVTIPPGEAATLRVTPGSDIDGLDATLCLATNDPNQPQQRIRIASSKPVGSFLGVGDEAPDFILEDLDGNTLQLSDQLGHPVVLVYFATW